MEEGGGSREEEAVRREEGAREEGGSAGGLDWSPRALSITWEVRGGALYPGGHEAQQIMVITTVVIGLP